MKRTAILIALMALGVTAHAERFLVDHEVVVPFELSVSMGLVDGTTHIHKYGVNDVVTTSTDPETIWDSGGVYPYDANSTTNIKYISSDSLADTNITIQVQGLDIDGAAVTQTATANGTNVVTLTTPLWRVFRMKNTSAYTNAGTLYCHTAAAPTAGDPDAADTRATIEVGHGQTFMAVYTIPAGCVGFVAHIEAGIELTGASPAAAVQYANIHFSAREYGKTFLVKKTFTCISGGNTSFHARPEIPLRFPSLTDLQISVDEVSATMGAWGAFDVLLVEEEMLTTAFLTSIGQPGY